MPILVLANMQNNKRAKIRMDDRISQIHWGMKNLDTFTIHATKQVPRYLAFANVICSSDKAGLFSNPAINFHPKPTSSRAS